jgi:hypothetical protein
MTYRPSPAKYFFTIPDGERYKECEISDKSLVNNRKLVRNKLMFVSNAVYELYCKSGEQQDIICNGIRDKVATFDVRDKHEPRIFAVTINGDDVISMQAFNRIYGPVTILDNEQDPPYGLTCDPEERN